jgi:hypothetical protein
LADTVAEKVTHPAGNPPLLLPFLTKRKPPSNQLTQEKYSGRRRIPQPIALDPGRSLHQRTQSKQRLIIRPRYGGVNVQDIARVRPPSTGVYGTLESANAGPAKATEPKLGVLPRLEHMKNRLSEGDESVRGKTLRLDAF